MQSERRVPSLQRLSFSIERSCFPLLSPAASSNRFVRAERPVHEEACTLPNGKLLIAIRLALEPADTCDKSLQHDGAEMKRAVALCPATRGAVPACAATMLRG